MYSEPKTRSEVYFKFAKQSKRRFIVTIEVTGCFRQTSSLVSIVWYFGGSTTMHFEVCVS